MSGRASPDLLPRSSDVVTPARAPARSVRFADHRRWRPEWTADRPCVYWYATFQDQREVAALARRLTGRAAALPAVDPVPARWLHLTWCDVGFRTDLGEARLAQVAAAVAERLAGHPPLRVTLGPLVVFRDAIALDAGPRPLLTAVRRELSAAMAACGVGEGRHHRVRAFWPHVSTAYVNGRVDRGEVLERLGDVNATTEVVVDRLVLACVRRAGGHYRWQELAEAPLAG